MSESNLPRKRVTNAERDRAAYLLHDAFADGQITITEFDERSRALYAATFSDESLPNNECRIFVTFALSESVKRKPN